MLCWCLKSRICLIALINWISTQNTQQFPKAIINGNSQSLDKDEDRRLSVSLLFKSIFTLLKLLSEIVAELGFFCCCFLFCFCFFFFFYVVWGKIVLLCFCYKKYRTSATEQMCLFTTSNQRFLHMFGRRALKAFLKSFFFHCISSFDSTNLLKMWNGHLLKIHLSCSLSNCSIYATNILLSPGKLFLLRCQITCEGLISIWRPYQWGSFFFTTLGVKCFSLL